MEQNGLTVVYTATRNLYPYLMASVMSLLDYNPNAKIYMLIEDDELPYEVPKNVECVNVSRQTLFSKRNCVNWNNHNTYMAMIRVAYSKMFTGRPNWLGIRELPELSRIIQLDVDTIVQDSLAPIWEIDLDGKWGAAVPDIPSTMRPWGINNKYFNAGVVVFNLDQIRKDRADDEAITMLRLDKMMFVDEMAWNKLNNLWLDRKFVDLDPRYNQTRAVQQTIEPAVVHYAGYRNWYKDIENMYRPYYMLKYSRFFHEE